MSSAQPAMDDRATRPAVVLLMGALFASALAYSAVLPVLPLILARSGLAPPAVTWHTGMLTGIYMLLVFVSAPLWGRFSDRVGRRPVIVLGLIGMSLALVGFALFRSLAPAYIARALTGVFVGAVIPVATAEVGDLSGRSTRAHRFALLTSASLLGFFIGPALSGWLSNATSTGRVTVAAIVTYVPVVAAAILSAMLAFAIARWLPRPSTTLRDVDPDVPIDASKLQRTAPALLVLVVMFALASFEVAITLRGQQRLGWSQAQIGVLFAECSAVMILIQGVLFATLVKRVSSGWLIGFGLGAMILGLALMPFTDKFGLLLFLVVLISAGASVVAPTITYRASLGARLARGAALGTQTAASSLGQALGSASVAALFGVSAAAPFWLAATLLAGGATFFLTGGVARPRTARLSLQRPRATQDRG